MELDPHILHNCVLDIVGILFDVRGDWTQVGNTPDFDGSHRYAWRQYRRNGLHLEVTGLSDARMSPLTQNPASWERPAARSAIERFTQSHGLSRIEGLTYLHLCHINHAEFLAECYFAYETARIVQTIRSGNVTGRKPTKRVIFDPVVVGDQQALLREATFLRLQETDYLR